MLISLLSLALSAPAVLTCEIAQPASPRETAAIDAATLLKNVQDAYRAGPVADKVEMSAAAKNDAPAKAPPAIKSVVTARLDAAGTVPSLRLELSDLVMHATPKELRAINRNEERSFALVELSGLTQQSLQEHLPPIPLPQVAFAFGDPDASLFKGIGKVQWEAPVFTQLGQARIYKVGGKHAAGSVRLTIDGSNWRLMQVVAEFHRAAGHTQLTLDITPVDAGPPDSWQIDTKGREQVASLAMLKPRDGEIHTGQRLPNIAGNSPNFGAWSLVEAFSEDRRRAAAGGKPAAAMMLILFRHSEDAVRSASILKDARAARTAAARAIADLHGGAEPMETLCEALVVFGGKEFDREAPARLSQEWSKDESNAPAKELRWSLSTSSTIDRIAPAASCIGVVILPDLTLAGTVALEGRGSDPASVANDFANLVRASVKK